MSTGTSIAWAPEHCYQAVESGSHVAARECTCTPERGCGEGDEAGCCYCFHSDIYEPCPVVGFICKNHPGAEQCECCTPGQFLASGVAYGLTPRLVSEVTT